MIISQCFQLFFTEVTLTWKAVTAREVGVVSGLWKWPCGGSTSNTHLIFPVTDFGGGQTSRIIYGIKDKIDTTVSQGLA